MNYPETFDEYPMRINAQAIRDTVAKSGEDEAVATVAIAIAAYANGKGVAFPSLDTIADQTGYTPQEASCYAHRGAAIGMFGIRKAKAKGAKYAHNVYTFAKNLIRKTSDIRSSHFIANVKKWRAEGKDVAQAIKKKARQSLNTLTAKAEKMAQLFQDRPELLDDPERAAELAGVADNPDVSDSTLEPESSQSVPSEMAAPVHTAPIAWENGGETWDNAPTSAEPPTEQQPTPTTSARIAALFGIPGPSHLTKTSTPAPYVPNLSDDPLPLYYQEQIAPATVDHSWRENVPGYQKNAATV